ncbi:MAG: hypothetical protein AAGC79_17335 [Pseudomonadota bacterium]
MVRSDGVLASFWPGFSVPTVDFGAIEVGWIVGLDADWASYILINAGDKRD